VDYVVGAALAEPPSGRTGLMDGNSPSPLDGKSPTGWDNAAAARRADNGTSRLLWLLDLEGKRLRTLTPPPPPKIEKSPTVLNDRTLFSPEGF